MSSLPQSCPLLSLPPEIIHLISDRLNHRSMAFFARTCHAIHALINPKLDRYFKNSCRSRLLWAVYNDKPETLNRALRNRALRNSGAETHPTKGWSDANAILLHKAICHSSSDAVKVLMAYGVSPNKKPTGTYFMPLAAAVMKGEVEIARTLLEAGADVNYRPDPGEGWSVTALAAWNKDWKMLDLLMEYYPEIPYESDLDSFCSGDEDDWESEEEE